MDVAVAVEVSLALAFRHVQPHMQPPHQKAPLLHSYLTHIGPCMAALMPLKHTLAHEKHSALVS